jgi:hypothetical protein
MSRNESGVWLVWMHFAGFAQNAEEYWCEIKAFSENDPKRSVVFSGDVIPITLDREIVQKTRNGLTFSNAIAHQLITKDAGENLKYGDKLCFNVSIGQR